MSPSLTPTTVPNAVVVDYRDWMPVILHPEDYEAWLDPRSKTQDSLRLLAPFPDERMSVRRTNLPARAKKGSSTIQRTPSLFE